MHKFNIDPVDYSKLGYKPEDIDPEILPIVDKFNLAGLKTQFSCQGHVHIVDMEDGKYLNYSLPYITFRDIDSLCKANLIENVDELDLCTLEITYESQLPHDKDIDFSICRTIEEYTKTLNNYKNMDHVLVIGIDKMLLDTDGIKSENTAKTQQEVFELARKRFLSELDKLAESCLRYRNIMNILYGEE